jgi:hypothetical protein
MNGKFIYTLATKARGKSYVTKWQVDKNFAPEKTLCVSNTPATCMDISIEGFYLGIGTSDGEIRSLNTRY